MVAFTGGAGTVDGLGVVYEWSDVIVVIENNVIVDVFSQFDGDALPDSGTDVSIGAFNVQLTNLTYQNIGGAVGVHNLALAAGATFTQMATNFVVSGTLTNNGLMNVYVNTTLTGALQNDGLMTIGAGDANVRFLRLADVAGGFSIGGAGDIRLRDGFITGEGGTGSVTDLSVQSRISGFGVIGSDFNRLEFPRDGGYLHITNTASGVIEADVAGRTLSLQPELPGTNPIGNFGQLRATNGGILALNGAAVDQFGSGEIWAGAGARVELNDAAISGGTLDGQAGGVILSTGNFTRLSNLAITETATVNAGRTLRLEGTIANNGAIVADNFLSTVLVDVDDVTLSGNGTLTMVSNYGGSSLQAEATGAQLTNGINHSILGNGTITGAGLSLVNDGLISAQHDSFLPDDVEAISFSGLGALRNRGILEASVGTKLALNFMEGVDNSNGTIRAAGDDAVVGLSQMSLSGGTFATSGTGVIQADGFNVRLSAFQTLAGTNFNATTMTFSGDIVNRGAMSVAGFLTLDGTTTLSGEGTLRLVDNFQGSHVVGKEAGAVLNNAGSTILGDGVIGLGVGLFNQAGNLSVINSGVIAADFDAFNEGSFLVLAGLASLSNTGVLEARNGATLSLQATVSGVIQNAGGTIRATGAGSVVDMSGVAVAGGALDATNGGRFTMTNVTLDGSTQTLTTNADFSVAGGRLTLQGAVANAGDILILDSGSLYFSGDTTLTGAGTITITPPYHFSIISLSGLAGATVNNLGNTFSGAGSIGANSGMVLVNGASGVISAAQAGATLVVQTGSVLTNNGLLIANGGILDVQDNVVGTGRLEVRNGGTLIVDQGTDQRVVFAGSSADTLFLSRRDGAAGGYDFPISGMKAGDRIALEVGAGQGQEAAFTFTNTVEGGILSSTAFIDNASAAYQLRLAGTYSTGQFQLIGGADGRLGYVRVATRDGGANADFLTAAVGGERVIGLGGDDTLIGRAGNDVLDGSQGSDTADFRYATSGVTVSLALSGAQNVGGGLGSDRLISIENIGGSAFNDALTGDDGANRLLGGAGADTLNGGAANDTLTGGAGDDWYYVDSAGDIIVEVSGGGTADRVLASVSFALAVDDFVETLSTTSDVGLTAINLTGNAASQTLTGNAAGNVLSGLGGNDTMNGLDGNDTLIGGTGADRMAGGGGDDSYVVDNAADLIDEVAGQGADRVLASVNFALAADDDIEILTTSFTAGVNVIALTGNGLAQSIAGNAGVNVLSGLGGNDTIFGFAGNDTLNGGSGVDSLLGGGGDDWYFVDNGGDILVEVAGGGVDRVLTTVSFVLAADDDIELLTTTLNSGTGTINLVGNALAQTLVGNAGANQLYGNGGNDTLFGLEGNDVLNGGAGVDSLIGGSGNDQYIIDSASDIIVETAGGGTADRVLTSVNFVLAADDDIEVMTTTLTAGTSAINLIGNGLSQNIVGNAGVNLLNGLGGDDSLLGFAGNDTLNGGTGNDVLSGGTGDDWYYVGAAADIIVEAAGGGTADRVLAAASFALAADDDIEILSTVAPAAVTAINLTGNGLGQIILGNAGANVLDGKGGNDTLGGGAGADTFVFSTALSATGNVDRINSYVAAEDVIKLDHTIFTGLALGTLNAANFIANGSGLATTTDHHIIYQTSTGNLYFDADGVGGVATAIQFAKLSPAAAGILATEFVVF